MALRRPAALIVHTHGFFQECAPGEAGVDDGLHAGIVLYGANRIRRANQTVRDGWLTAKEVALLNLDGTHLVLCSAATRDVETGRARMFRDCARRWLWQARGRHY